MTQVWGVNCVSVLLTGICTSAGHWFFLCHFVTSVKNSKRHPYEEQWKEEREASVIIVVQKLELTQQLDCGVSVRILKDVIYTDAYAWNDVNKSKLTTCLAHILAYNGVWKLTCKWRLWSILCHWREQNDIKHFYLCQKFVSGKCTSVRGSWHHRNAKHWHDAPVIHSLSDDKIAEMLLNTNKHKDGDNEDGDNILHTKKSPYTVWWKCVVS
jgi:hypothetical protein